MPNRVMLSHNLEDDRTRIQAALKRRARRYGTVDMKRLWRVIMYAWNYYGPETVEAWVYDVLESVNGTALLDPAGLWRLPQDNMEDGYMRCTKCGQVKHLSAFYRETRPGRSRNGYRQQCKVCARAWHKAYYQANLEQERARSRAKNAQVAEIRRRYGLKRAKRGAA